MKRTFEQNIEGLVGVFNIYKKNVNLALNRLESYQRAINKLDDYFEYRNESVKDREVVHAILAKLTKEISSND